MPRRTQYVIGVTERQRDQINALAAELTGHGPGKYGQPETIQILLDAYREYQALLDDIRNRYQEATP